MREIKFRVWLNNLNEMIYSWHYENDNGSELADFFNDIYPLNYNDVLMQYTGLNDLNNKEIYEGDILVNKLGEKGIVKWSQVLVCYRIEREGSSPMYITEDFDKHQMVLIGNIYENPELIK